MRKYLVSLALVAVLGLSAAASSFTGAQETEAPTDLAGSCVSVESSPTVEGTPNDATPDATPDSGTPDVVGTPADDEDSESAAGTPESTPGTPDATPGVEDCATPQSTPDE